MKYYIFPNHQGQNVELEPTKYGLKVSIGNVSTYIDFEKLKEYVEKVNAISRKP